jgi:uncharacterized protein YcfJ
MKYSIPLIAATLAAACNTVMAAEFGKVISSTAVVAQVAVPQQQCRDERQLLQRPTSGGGALLGALIGGAVGNNIGGGLGRAAATGLGVVAGAAIGDRTEAANSPPTEVPVRSCLTVTSYENRIVGYDVTYDYNGQRYTTRLAQDPGARVALDVTVVPSGGTMAVAPASPFPTPMATVMPPMVYSPVPAYGYDGPYGYYDYYGYGGSVFAVMPRVVLGGYRRHGY